MSIVAGHKETLALMTAYKVGQVKAPEVGPLLVRKGLMLHVEGKIYAITDKGREFIKPLRHSRPPRRS
jgi:predicted transcriptional regulator